MGKKRAWIFFLLPSFAGVLVFVLCPFADVVRRSFLTAITGRFVGLQNYRIILENTAFRTAMKNTFLFTAFCIPLLVAMGLLLALALSETEHLRLIKSFYLFPMAMPTAAIAIVWKMLFYKQGFFNKYLAVFLAGGSPESRGFPADYLGTGAAFFLLAGTYIWKNLGYTIVLWLAGIMGINGEMLEAAQVDGAGKVQRLIYILLPSLKNSMYTIVVLSFLNSFKIYREAYLVAGPYPHESIYMLQHLFNNWFVNLDLDKMAAAAVVCGAVFLAGILLLQRAWKVS